MKRYLVIAGIVIAMAGAAPAQAAGCIKGAVVGAVAAHVTHHSMLLGALGGCIIGKVVSHPSSSVTYAQVTGQMLGSDADFAKLASASRVNIVKLSSLKGYVRHDKRVQDEIGASTSVKALDTEVAGNANLSATLKSAGFAPTDVVAIDAGGALGGATLFVNG
jgi:hypothetical protein